MTNFIQIRIIILFMICAVIMPINIIINILGLDEYYFVVIILSYFLIILISCLAKNISNPKIGIILFTLSLFLCCGVLMLPMLGYLLFFLFV
ncbi:MAG: hypothetical protein EOP34_10860 [Rickettsiales bacterium]|nr:MAG: hypothetical protein EOP34_10860 [Rickettsiales bacterium]